MSEADTVLAMLATCEWMIRRLRPNDTLPHTTGDWAVTRAVRPWCDCDHFRTWHGHTALQALQAAHTAIHGQPFTTAESAPDR